MAEKELPGEIEKLTGMRKLFGYMKDYRYHVYVPTTIFDPQAAILYVYEPENHYKQKADAPEKVVVRKAVTLKSMPTWNVEYQCLQLSKQDEQKVKSALRNLEKRLENSSRH
ncbi:hypothetical protein HY484_01950 [Candidatus Woesearchaeota archaeon]|nr:hypothetical protein [Candidatus Woesearchaeota archaeon]